MKLFEFPENKIFQWLVKAFSCVQTSIKASNVIFCRMSLSLASKSGCVDHLGLS